MPVASAYAARTIRLHRRPSIGISEVGEACGNQTTHAACRIQSVAVPEQPSTTGIRGRKPVARKVPMPPAPRQPPIAPSCDGIPCTNGGPPSSASYQTVSVSISGSCPSWVTEQAVRDAVAAILTPEGLRFICEALARTQGYTRQCPTGCFCQPNAPAHSTSFVENGASWPIPVNGSPNCHVVVKYNLTCQYDLQDGECKRSGHTAKE